MMNATLVKIRTQIQLVKQRLRAIALLITATSL
jgi:hypothetical protein